METSTVIKKSGFGAKIVIFRSNKFLCHFNALQKKLQELPENGVDKRLNASE
jgi:hypothetical protein